LGKGLERLKRLGTSWKGVEILKGWEIVIRRVFGTVGDLYQTVPELATLNSILGRIKCSSELTNWAGFDILCQD
jgi:hypothetical protein